MQKESGKTYLLGVNGNSKQVKKQTNPCHPVHFSDNDGSNLTTGKNRMSETNLVENMLLTPEIKFTLGVFF